MPLVKLSRKRQVVIPQDIAERFGLVPGDYVEIVENNGQIVIQPKDVVDRVTAAIVPAPAPQQV